MANSFVLCTIVSLMVLSSVNHSMADPDPAPGSRYGPWSMINNPQPFFNPMTSSPSRLHRPYYVGYHNAPEVDEDYESAAMVAKMSRLLDTALVHLNEEVNELKDQVRSESERNRRLEQQVNQLKQSVARQQEQQEFGADDNISQYARLNGLVTTALGLGRPWVKTFFSFRKTSSFATLQTPITYEITDSNVGSTVSSGVFTAPRAGYYYFSFNGITDGSVNTLNAALVKNGNIYTTAFGTAASYSPLSIQELLVLSPGDTVSIQLQTPTGATAATTGTLYEDGSSYFTRFTGFSIVLL